MTTPLTLATIAKNAGLDAECALCNSGKLKVYSGTPPANAGAALSGNTLLATLTFGSTAFAAASGGTATANAITSDTNAGNAGTATFARCTKSDDTVVNQMGVGTSGSGEPCIINNAVIAVGDTVQCSSLTWSK